MAKNVGTAYVQILPSTKGMKDALSQALSSEGGAAAKSSGADIGSILSGSIGGGIQSGGIGGALTSALQSGLDAAMGAITAAGSAIFDFGKGAVGAGMDFDNAMSQVAATMGKTTDEIGDLREFAMQMGSETAFSATEAAEALNYMALAGYKSEESMQMLPTVLDLAASGNMSLAKASDMVTDTQSALGLSLEETMTMVDQMAKTASTTNTSVSQLGDGMLTIGATARNMKGGTVELTQVLGILADNGIKASEGGTHLRNMLLSLQEPSEAGAAALAQLGMTYDDMYDASGNMRSIPEILQQMSAAMEGMTQQSRDAIVSGVFNKTDLASVNALLGTTTERWEEVETAIANASGTPFDLTKVAKQIQDTGVQWEKYGDKAWMVDGAFEEMTGNIQDYLETQGKTAEETAELIAEQYGISLEDATAAVGEVDEALQKATGSAEQMAKTQLDNLSGDMVYFKSALEGAQLLLSGALTPTLREFVQLGTDGMKRVTDAFNENGFSGAMEEAGKWLSESIVKITEILPGIAEAGTQVLSSLMSGITSNLPQILDGVGNALGILGNAFADNMPTLTSSILGALATVIDDIGNNLPDMTVWAVNFIFNMVDAIGANMGPLADGAWKVMDGLAKGIENSIPVVTERLPGVLTGITDWIGEHGMELGAAGTSILEAISKAIGEAMPILSESMPGIISGISDTFTANVGPVTKAGTDILTTVGQGIADAIPTFAEEAPGIITSMANALSENIPDLLSTGLAILNALIKGISDSIPSAIDGLGTVTESIVNWFSENSDDVAQTGITILQTIGDGITGAIDELLPYLPQILEAVVKGVSDNLPLLVDTGLNILTEMATSIINNIPTIVAAIPDIITALVNAILESIPKIATAGVDLLDSLIDNLPEIIDAVVLAIPEIVGGLVGALAEHGPDIVTAGFDLLTQLITDVAAIIDEIVKAIPEIVDGIVGAFKEQWDKIKQAGSDLIGGLTKGITDGAAAAIEGAKQVAGDVLGAITGFFGISSPSKVMRQMGIFIDEGFAEGIEGGVDGPLGAIKALASSVESAFNPRLSLDSAVSSGSALGATGYSPYVAEHFGTTYTGSSGDTTVVLALDGRELARTTVPYINQENRRIGVNFA